MAFTIKIVDCNDPLIDLALRDLIAAAYHGAFQLPEKFLATQLDSRASRPGFFLVAEENDKIVGCMGFLANDFLINDIAYAGYQCCQAATHPDHRGKNIYTRIVNEGKKILEEQGAGFLYAVSNDKVAQLLTKKLGFLGKPSLVLRIPRIPFFKKIYIKKGARQNMLNACSINEEQLKEHKARQFPSEIKVIRVNDSWIWGKRIRKTKFGITIPVFYVGGIHLAHEKDLGELISAIFKFHKVLFVQFFTCATNTFNSLLKGWKKAPLIDFVFYDLNMPEFEHLNLMIGSLDVF